MQELDSEGGLAIGAVEVKGRTDVTRVLALADEALAAAEAGPAFAVAEIGSGREVVAFGDSVWQQRLAAALERNQTTLAGFPVCAADGNLLYLDCPMRVCIDGDDGGDDEQAWRWLAPAARGKLSRQLDLRAIDLALAAISRDGQARCINIGTDSVAASEFMLLATQALESAPDAARRLWIDLPESMALRHRALLVETARRWRPLGVRLALEHAGTDLPRIADLGGLGIDCVRIDARFVSGLTGPDSTAARRRLQALVNQVHGAGLRISAEGVALAGDLAVVWALGFDAATGPAVLKRGHSISPK